MNLLTRTIKEYLNEHHREWTIVQSCEYIYITSHQCLPDKYVLINSRRCVLISPGNTDVMEYTDGTVLTLLTSIISQLESK